MPIRCPCLHLSPIPHIIFPIFIFSSRSFPLRFLMPLLFVVFPRSDEVVMNEAWMSAGSEVGQQERPDGCASPVTIPSSASIAVLLWGSRQRNHTAPSRTGNCAVANSGDEDLSSSFSGQITSIHCLRAVVSREHVRNGIQPYVIWCSSLYLRLRVCV